MPLLSTHAIVLRSNRPFYCVRHYTKFHLLLVASERNLVHKHPKLLHYQDLKSVKANTKHGNGQEASRKWYWLSGFGYTDIPEWPNEEFMIILMVFLFFCVCAGICCACLTVIRLNRYWIDMSCAFIQNDISIEINGINSSRSFFLI